MRHVYADTSYWLALLNREDQLHGAAVEATKALGGSTLVTSEAVLMELLNYASKYEGFRKAAAERVQRILDNVNIEVEPLTHRGFVGAFDLYREREDKTYSLVDCFSMKLMRDRDIRDVLTSDHHFDQEGFTVLLD